MSRSRISMLCPAVLLVIVSAAPLLYAQTDGIWQGRRSYATAVFDAGDGERLWLTGGTTTGSTQGAKRDVWSTDDGVNWRLEVAEAPWVERMSHALVAFDGKLWLLGGSIPGSYSDEIWVSEDGVIWEPVEPVGQHWVGRGNLAAEVFNGRLWVMGGFGGTGVSKLNDVWSTDNGVNWVNETPSEEQQHWTPRESFGSTVFNGRLWVVGGIDSSGRKNDVWYTEDGDEWFDATDDADWEGRYGLAVVSFDPGDGDGERMWLMGGSHYASSPTSPQSKNDIWTSFDGEEWEEVSATDHWHRRYHHAAEVFLGGIWILGGYDINLPVSERHMNDAWVSENGEDWLQAPRVTSVPVTTATAGEPYLYQITAVGSPILIVDAPGLPGWLQLIGDDLTGTPQEDDIGESDTITVTAANSAGIHVQQFSVHVEGVPPQFVSPPVTSVIVGQDYSYTVEILGIPAPALWVENKPAWLDFDPATGELSGTAPAQTEITDEIKIIASNDWGEVEQTFTIAVGTPPHINSDPVLFVEAGAIYSYFVQAGGFPTPTLSAAGYPHWMTFSATTGELFGPAPTEGGVTGEITIMASNGVGDPYTQTFVVTISLSPVIVSLPAQSVSAGGQYSYIVEATGFPTPDLSVGDLPDWLNFNPATGELTGIAPLSPLETDAIIITAANGVGADTQTFTIQVEFLPPVSGGGGGCALRPGSGRSALGGTGLALGLIALAWIGVLARRRRYASPR